MQPGVFKYSLESPIDVQSGDVVGVSYDTFGGSQLRLSFLDMMVSGREAPISYRRRFTSSVLIDVSSNAATDNRYVPLVTPIMGKTN